MACGAGLLGAGALGHANADQVTKAYTIQMGDTLSEIATKFDTNVNELKQLNHLNSDLIIAGDTLQVPVSVANAQPATTTVQAAKPVTPVATSAPAQPVATKVTNQASSQTNSTVPQYHVAQAAAQPANTVNTTNNNTNGGSSNSDNLSGSEQAAKDWIMQRESGGNYNARNGQYVGAFQLSSSYLNGDYSPANQNRVADQYVTQRYGSWTAAKAHWEANNWY